METGQRISSYLRSISSTGCLPTMPHCLNDRYWVGSGRSMSA